MRITAAAFVLMLFPAAAQAATPITGTWVTEDGKGVIAIQPCGKVVCGRIVKLTSSVKAGITTDVNNADPKLRGRPLIGLPILTGFTDIGPEWRGSVYSPEEGKTYKSMISRSPDGTLKVKGCIMIFCKKQTWRPLR